MLPKLLEKVNRLAALEQYLCGLEETASFLIFVRQFAATEESRHGADALTLCASNKIQPWAELESSRANDKIIHQQRLCRTYRKQTESLLQVAVSYSTSSIISRLDAGGRSAERLAKIGLMIASITAVVSPLSLVTSYFGMNVPEFADGSHGSLYAFWSVATPMLLILGLFVLFSSVWFLAGRRRRQ